MKFSQPYINCLFRKGQLNLVEFGTFPELTGQLIADMNSQFVGLVIPSTHILISSTGWSMMVVNDEFQNYIDLSPRTDDFSMGFIGTLFGKCLLTDTYLSYEDQTVARLEQNSIIMLGIDPAHFSENTLSETPEFEVVYALRSFICP